MKDFISEPCKVEDFINRDFNLQHTLSEWVLVFWIAFGVFAITNMVYIFFGSGEVQPWNIQPEKTFQSGDNNINTKDESIRL